MESYDSPSTFSPSIANSSHNNHRTPNLNPSLHSTTPRQNGTNNHTHRGDQCRRTPPHVVRHTRRRHRRRMGVCRRGRHTKPLPAVHLANHHVSWHWIVAFVFVRCFLFLHVFGVESSTQAPCPTEQIDGRRCGRVVWMVIRLVISD